MGARLVERGGTAGERPDLCRPLDARYLDVRGAGGRLCSRVLHLRRHCAVKLYSGPAALAVEQIPPANESANREVSAERQRSGTCEEFGFRAGRADSWRTGRQVGLIWTFFLCGVGFQ